MFNPKELERGNAEAYGGPFPQPCIPGGKDFEFSNTGLRESIPEADLEPDAELDAETELR